MQWGLEGGIAAGIVLATLYFAAAYAQSQVWAANRRASLGPSVRRARGMQLGGLLVVASQRRLCSDGRLCSMRRRLEAVPPVAKGWQTLAR